MSRYFFHVHDHSGDYPDEDGMECPGFEAVRAAAVAGIRSIVCDEASRGCIDLRGHLEVLDEAGVRVLLLTFADAVALIPPEAPR